MVLADRHSYYPFYIIRYNSSICFPCKDVCGIEFHKLFVVTVGGANKKKRKIKQNMQHHYSDHP